MTPIELAKHIANTSFYPTTASELQTRVEDLERLGYEVVLRQPIDLTPEIIPLKAQKPLLFLCANCGSKIGGDGKCQCGQHFPNELCY